MKSRDVVIIKKVIFRLPDTTQQSNLTINQSVNQLIDKRKCLQTVGL